MADSSRAAGGAAVGKMRPGVAGAVLCLAAAVLSLWLSPAAATEPVPAELLYRGNPLLCPFVIGARHQIRPLEPAQVSDDFIPLVPAGGSLSEYKRLYFARPGLSREQLQQGLADPEQWPALLTAHSIAELAEGEAGLVVPDHGWGSYFERCKGGFLANRQLDPARPPDYLASHRLERYRLRFGGQSRELVISYFRDPKPPYAGNYRVLVDAGHCPARYLYALGPDQDQLDLQLLQLRKDIYLAVSDADAAQIHLFSPSGPKLEGFDPLCRFQGARSVTELVNGQWTLKRH